MQSQLRSSLSPVVAADRPQPGDTVTFLRGAVVGTVRMVSPDAFQVATGDLLLWVKNTAILSRSEEGVRLLCDAVNLHQYAGRPVTEPTRPAMSQPTATMREPQATH